MTLPADVSRCQGIAADGMPCDIRHKCERYLALLDTGSQVSTMRMMCERAYGGMDASYPFFIPAKP